MGVTPLECKESVQILQNKNFKEHYVWCIEHMYPGHKFL